MAIETLATSLDGWPADSAYQIMGTWCIWEIAEHTIIYERDEADFCIYIWLLKPME